MSSHSIKFAPNLKLIVSVTTCVLIVTHFPKLLIPDFLKKSTYMRPTILHGRFRAKKTTVDTYSKYVAPIRNGQLRSNCYKHETTPRANYCRSESNYKFYQPYFVSYSISSIVLFPSFSRRYIFSIRERHSNVKFQIDTIQQLYLFFLDRSYVCMCVCVCTRSSFCVYPRAFSVMQVQMLVLGSVNSNNNSGNRSE